MPTIKKSIVVVFNMPAVLCGAGARVRGGDQLPEGALDDVTPKAGGVREEAVISGTADQ